jgi:hypothetical protein
LLQNFGVAWVGVNDALIGILSLHVLCVGVSWGRSLDEVITYVLLLFKYMPDLEPNIRMGEGTWWIAKYMVEAL